MMCSHFLLGNLDLFNVFVRHLWNTILIIDPDFPFKTRKN